MARRGRGLGYSTSTLSALKSHVTGTCGSHYFDRDTMRFFNSKLHKVYPGNGISCFVTSEKFDDTTPRKFTVRKIQGCKIDTVDDFQKYGSLSTAQTAAKACAAGQLSGARRRRRR
jgi:hypothetical protein